MSNGNGKWTTRTIKKSKKRTKRDKRRSKRTKDEVAQMQKAKAEYNEKYLKDKEVAEAFDKQSQVKLGNLGGE